MNDSKIRRNFKSSDTEEPKYNDYSSLPPEQVKPPEAANRFFMSGSRKELSETKREYVEASRPQYSFEKSSPKGLYADPKAGVVDEYASNSDWRARIQKAVAESEKRINPEKAERKPWPDAPTDFRQKEPLFDNLFETDDSESEESVDSENLIWEIDEKVTRESVSSPRSDSLNIEKETFVPETKKETTIEAAEVELKNAIREEAYIAWLAERNEKNELQHSELIQNITIAKKKQQRAETYDKWMAERETRIIEDETCLKRKIEKKAEQQKRAAAYENWISQREAHLEEEDACMKIRIAKNAEKQKRAAAYDNWISQREARLEEEDACMKIRIEKNVEKQKRAAAYDNWISQREARLEEEDACMKIRIEKNAEKQKRAAAYENWISQREARLEEEDVCMTIRIAEKQKKQARSAEYDKWFLARERRISEEESALCNRILEKSQLVFDEDELLAAEEFDASECEFENAEAEFEAVCDSEVSDIFEQEECDTVSASEIEIYTSEAGIEIAESDIKIAEMEIEVIDVDLEVGGSSEDLIEVQVDEEFDNDLQILMSEKKNLEQLRSSKTEKNSESNLDDEFVV